MTITKAIGVVDKIRPNQYSTDNKREWILTIENRIKNEIYLTHDHDEIPFTDFDRYGDDTELFAPSPYDEIYILYLCGMIDFNNAEYNRYNNDVELFNKTFEDYARWYNRNNVPLSTALRY